ncbi:hypothetical protein ACFXAS_05375 [Streptomyces sp. NPDC059459]|uniref:hypothetical protein n=1 Tax=Streptomyces sp. NPDC059459 TaxID=3346839 RepID=UPI0036C5883F
MMAADMGALPPVLSVPGLAAWLGIEKDTPPDVDTEALAEVARLSTREVELLAEIAAVRELNFELRTARNFADSKRSGYIDDDYLEKTDD